MGQQSWNHTLANFWKLLFNLLFFQLLKITFRLFPLFSKLLKPTFQFFQLFINFSKLLLSFFSTFQSVNKKLNSRQLFSTFKSWRNPTFQQLLKNSSKLQSCTTDSKHPQLLRNSSWESQQIINYSSETPQELLRRSTNHHILNDRAKPHSSSADPQNSKTVKNHQNIHSSSKAAQAEFNNNIVRSTKYFKNRSFLEFRFWNLPSKSLQKPNLQHTSFPKQQKSHKKMIQRKHISTSLSKNKFIRH